MIAVGPRAGYLGRSVPETSYAWCEMNTTAIVLVCLIASLASAAADDDEKINGIVKQLAAVKHAHEYPELYRSLFAAARADKLTRLQSLADDSIAIQSAWEAVNLTVPVQLGDRPYRPDSGKLNWFLGFLQGRARVSPPGWWRAAVLTARANQRNNIYPGKLKPKPYHHTGIGWACCPKDASVARIGDSYIYQVGAKRVTIPDEILVRFDSGELWYSISGCFTDKHCFLATYSDLLYSHDLACVDRSSDKLVWKSTVCGCFWGGATGMAGESYVSVVTAEDDRVFAFGADLTGFYAHGFRASDGKSLTHFSSSY